MSVAHPAPPPAEKLDSLRRHDPDQVRGSAVARTLSALALPCRGCEATPGRALLHAPAAWEAWAMLRLLRERAVTGVVSVTLLVMMVALSAPFLLPMVHWVFGLL